eukprot:scaffold2384_cov80-Cylindrotheca_fusiformis.AAC.2
MVYYIAAVASHKQCIVAHGRERARADCAVLEIHYTAAFDSTEMKLAISSPLVLVLLSMANKVAFSDDAQGCYICGSPDIAMTRAASDESLSVFLTQKNCSALERYFNEEGLPCDVLEYGDGSIVDTASLCGCEGAVAPKLPECVICDGGSSLIPGATYSYPSLPNETASCEESSDFLSIIVNGDICPERFANTGLSKAEIEEQCCEGDSGGGGGDSDVPTSGPTSEPTSGLASGPTSGSNDDGGDGGRGGSGSTYSTINGLSVVPGMVVLLSFLLY